MLKKMDCHGLTDIGRKRETNEDQFLVADLSKSMRVYQTSLGFDHQARLFGVSQGKLLLVADGMGGHAAGERASTVAVDSVTGFILNSMCWLFRLDESSEDEFLDDLKSVLQRCQADIRVEAESMPARAGMGTTVTMAYIVWPRLYVVHAGDSRCYLLRDSKLEQVTKDHTVAQYLVEQGGLKPEEAEGSRWSNTLWNVVGGDSNELKPEVYKGELVLGDTLLLCTDGLTKHVPDEEIIRLLDSEPASEEVCRRLVNTANDAGGSDNITVVVARFRNAGGHKAASESEVALEETVGQAGVDAERQPTAAAGAAKDESTTISRSHDVKPLPERTS